MAIFLNTDKLNEWIPRLIEETKRELVIIVPYIKTSDRVFQHLMQANNRRVETVLVYRENKLSASEKLKFEALDNLNLMHHPNVHCKCYYNEKYLIITSMNMYEYSEKNNREMGILLHRETLNTKSFHADDKQIFADALAEIVEIMNGAHLEKESRETKDFGFEIEIVKTSKEKAIEKCQILNKAFVHKRFDIVEVNNEWYCRCSNYFDKIEVLFSHRAEITLGFSEARQLEIYQKLHSTLTEFVIPGFKLYWSYHKSPIYLYANSKHQLWKHECDRLTEFTKYRKGIDTLVSSIRTTL